MKRWNRSVVDGISNLAPRRTATKPRLAEATCGGPHRSKTASRDQRLREAFQEVLPPRLFLFSDEREARLYAEIIDGETDLIELTIVGRRLVVTWTSGAEGGHDRKGPVEEYGAEVALPYGVDADRASTDFADGVLLVRLPRATNRTSRCRVEE